MQRFQHRSKQKELMDAPSHNAAEVFQNLKEIAWINKLTGGGARYLKYVSNLIHSAEQKVTLLDIGFGAGDFLYRLAQEFDQSKIELHGIDIMEEAVATAYDCYPILKKRAKLQQAHYQAVFDEGQEYDIITANLFCHHLDRDALIWFIQQAVARARHYVIINDLRRHPVSYWGIKILTQLFSGSRYTQHDAPLSVLKGFTTNEWKRIFVEAGLDYYDIKPIWSYRHRIRIQGSAKLSPLDL